MKTVKMYTDRGSKYIVRTPFTKEKISPALRAGDAIKANPGGFTALGLAIGVTTFIASTALKSGKRFLERRSLALQNQAPPVRGPKKGEAQPQ